MVILRNFYKIVINGLILSLFQLSSLLLGITDPFVPFENLFCAVFMGGLFDVIQGRVEPRFSFLCSETDKSME